MTSLIDAVKSELTEPQAIDCQNLTVSYGGKKNLPVLSHINVQIQPREFVAILGLNGAGKSTWLRCLAGLIPIQQGRLKILGHTVTPQSYQQIRRRLGIIVQGGGLIPQLSVLDNVLCGCLGRYSSWQTISQFPATEQARALLLLKQFGLAAKAQFAVKQLSGGQQQRVAIARALMQNVDILLADEPTNGLDVIAAKQVMDTFAQLNQEQGITIITVLHDLEMAALYADRAIVLAAGQIFYDGTANCLPQIFADLQAR